MLSSKNSPQISCKLEPVTTLFGLKSSGNPDRHTLEATTLLAGLPQSSIALVILRRFALLLLLSSCLLAACFCKSIHSLPMLANSRRMLITLNSLKLLQVMSAFFSWCRRYTPCRTRHEITAAGSQPNQRPWCDCSWCQGCSCWGVHGRGAAVDRSSCKGANAAPKLRQAHLALQ
eukprot:GHUV01037059.1.p1 GENE.GHUV01037059.1~~GHUV01037059.1.p1  ORF type:complete len:175 (+),score=19.50 GHUV01037059.1:759-1283(+)